MVRSETLTLTRSLTDLRQDTLAIVRAGIRAADARVLIEQALSTLMARAAPEVSTTRAQPCVHVLAAGKAADAMVEAVAQRLGGAVRSALVITSAGPAAEPSAGTFTRVIGGHPTPTAASEEGGRRALALAGSLAADDRLLVLLSGGASALMAAPVDGVSLADKRRTTEMLLRAGADIHALNTVRKHLSDVKGGRLAAATRASCDALVISDVVGDDPSVIASGPTVADATRFADALEIVRRFGGEDAFPRSVVEHLRRGDAGDVEETPKPGDARLARTTTTVIGSRRNAMQGAVVEAAARGYRVVRIDDPIVGEARQVAASHLRVVAALASGIERPTCIVSSGETTVHVKGSGQGGRNQELVLAGAEVLQQLGTYGAIASVGTDGIDGPTDAAGAYADGSTIDRALADGLAPDTYLSNNNSYAFFQALGDLIHTGPTGTNVGDLQIILLA